MFKKHFNFVVPSALVKQLYETKKKNKNDKLVNVLTSGFSDLKDEIKEMSKDEKHWATGSNIKNCWRGSWV